MADTPYGDFDDLEKACTIKLVKAIRNIVSGMSHRESAILAGYAPKSAHVTIHHALKKPNAQALLAAYQYQNRQMNTADRLLKRQRLAWAMTESTVENMLRAIVIDNNMTGDNKPISIDLGSDDLSQLIADIRATKD